MSDRQPPPARLRVRIVGVGLHPDERLIELRQADGCLTQSFAWVQQIDAEGVAVSLPLDRKDDGALLVQLPQETLAGHWRVWVDPDDLVLT